MRIVYFGSGAFGLPTLRALVKRHDIALVITQPDRPAGRSRRPTPTAVEQFARSRNLDILTPENVNDSAVVESIRAVAADACVVIAYGQKLSRDLLADRFAINLHGSLLPKYRGAAPVNWAIINGEKSTGLSVITLADRMDAGDILGQVETPIDPHETAGELHDRLAALGPDLIEAVLQRVESGQLTRAKQDESNVSYAPKLSKQDGTVDFDQPADRVRARIHGLTPWPGCRVTVGNGGDNAILRLHRAKVASMNQFGERPGTLVDSHAGLIACNPGVIQLLAVHPPGGTMLSFAAYERGRRLGAGTLFRPLDHQKDPV